MRSVVTNLHEAAVDRVVARAVAGDTAALADIYDRFAERVYRFLLLHAREPADAEDLLQRTFLKVIEGLPRYEARGLPFGAWVFRIARNTVIDHERTRHDHATLDAVIERHDERRGPAELAETADEQAAVLAALVLLTPDQREVITYRFFAGLSPREIGLLMDKREGSVRALQFRAMETLRENLASHVDLVSAAGVRV
jgi:RNA polymerase sigma-70 factor (ECF subfamily)